MQMCTTGALHGVNNRKPTELKANYLALNKDEFAITLLQLDDLLVCFDAIGQHVDT